MNRRKFNKSVGLGAFSLATGMGLGCKGDATNKAVAKTAETLAKASDKAQMIKLSLAQWSLHKAHFDGSLDPFAFASKAKELGFSGLEYVSGIYKDHMKAASSPLAGAKSLSSMLLEKSKATGTNNVLIMIDGEGDLGIPDKTKRLEGVENHKKWVDAAHALGCHSIRVNLFGEGTREEQEANSSDSMRLLGEYARPLNVNIIVENHGGLSSDPHWVTKVMKNVSMSNVGTLPDFGNFCIEREGGERWGAPCINEYPDIYEAVNMMMPFAKAVSAKSYDFDAEGNETKIDYYKMMRIVQDAGYNGYVGVEFEGEMPEEEGIIATKKLLLKTLNSSDH